MGFSDWLICQQRKSIEGDILGFFPHISNGSPLTLLHCYAKTMLLKDRVYSLQFYLHAPLNSNRSLPNVK